MTSRFASMAVLWGWARQRVAECARGSPWCFALLTGLAFLAAALSARAFLIRSEILAPVWIATAVLIFALLQVESRRAAMLVILASFLAGFMANAATHVPLVASLGFAGVNCVGGVVGAALLRDRLGTSASFASVRNIAYLLLCGSLSSAASATCGALIVSHLSLAGVTHSWVVWWLSNTLGLLVVFPLLTELFCPAPAKEHSGQSGWLEGAVLFACLALIIVLGFGHASSFITPLLAFPLLAWAGLRFSPLGAAGWSCGVTLLVLFSQAHGSSTHVFPLSVMELQLFLAVAVVSALIPSAALAERRATEARMSQALDQAEIERLRLSAVLDALPAGIAIADRNGRIEHFNATVARLWSTPPTPQSIGEYTQWHGYWPGSGRRLQPDEWALARALRNGEVISGDILEIERVPGGERRTILNTAAPIRDTNGQIVGAVGAEIDITAQLQAEARLRRSEERFRAFVIASSDAIYSVNADWSEMRQLDGHGFLSDTREPTRDWLDGYVLPEDKEGILAAIHAAVATRSVYQLEHRVRRADGTIGWMLSRAVPMLNADGEIEEWIGNASDISARKLAEEAVRDSERRFRQLSELVPQIIWATDPRGRPVYVNERWLDYTGKSLAETTDLIDLETVHPDEQDSAVAAWRQSIATGKPLELECRLLGREGQYRWFICRATPVRDDFGRIRRWFGSCTDIDDIKRAQQALVRSEKLASVGRMAATVAHEINNPLEVITNSVYLASLDPNLSDSARRNMAVAEQELERVAHLTRQTLGFYRENAAPAKVDLSRLVRGVVELYLPKLNQNGIRVEADYREQLNIRAIAGEIRQVVSNLIANAIDASPRGLLRIRTSRIELNGAKFVRMSFADTGEGIAPGNLVHLFEPFFTTKATVGTGLGLWVSSEIVHRHRGRIRVRSRLGHGTVFSVLLPETEHPTEVRTATSEAL